MGLISKERDLFHKEITSNLLVIDRVKLKSGPQKGALIPCASNADKDNTASRFISLHVAEKIGAKDGKKLDGQTAGHRFERCVADFLDKTFKSLGILRPGYWSVLVSGSRTGTEISKFEQYQHTDILQHLSENDQVLKASLGNDYVISPDIVISRGRVEDSEINIDLPIVDLDSARAAMIRKSVASTEILHASVSCKWTMRSDRAQNSRSEALNLIRNRKGRCPHIVAVTAEPTPSRLSSLALGTGDLDCVYHFALYELVEAVAALGQSEAESLLKTMIDGKRLKDISDLPLDLTI